MDENKSHIEWGAPEFNYAEKQPEWFLGAGVFAAIFLIFSIWQHNLLFTIFILIATSLLFFWGKEKPKIIHFIADNEGLDIGGYKFYPWESLSYFAIMKFHREHDHLAEFIFKKDERLNPFLKVHVPSDKIDEVRGFILNHIKEGEHTESYIDAIERWIRF